MAEAADDAQLEEAAAAGPGQKKHSDEQTQGLEKVTDYVEEQEISGLGQVRALPVLLFVAAAWLNIFVLQAVTNIESDMAKKQEEKAKR